MLEGPILDRCANAADNSLQTVYTDGSCLNNGNKNAIAGAGIYIDSIPPIIHSIKIPNELQQSNQIGEIIAIKEAMERLPKDRELLIRSDSRTTIDGLTKL